MFYSQDNFCFYCLIASKTGADAWTPVTLVFMVLRCFSERAELLKLRAVMLQPRSADALEWQMRWEEVSVRCIDRRCEQSFIMRGGTGIPGVL